MDEQKLSWSSFDFFKVIKVKGHARFWILGVEFLLVSLSNYVSVSHRLGVGGDRPLLRAQGDSRSKVELPFDKPGHGEHFVNRQP